MADDEGTYQFTLAGLVAPPRFVETWEAEAFLEFSTTAGTLANAAYLGVSLPKDICNDN